MMKRHCPKYTCMQYAQLARREPYRRSHYPFIRLLYFYIIIIIIIVSDSDVMNIRDSRRRRRRDGRQIDEKQPKQITEDKCSNFPLARLQRDSGREQLHSLALSLSRGSHLSILSLGGGDDTLVPRGITFSPPSPVHDSRCTVAI